MTELRKRKVPQYQQEISAIVVNEELVDELEWKTEQYRQQKELMESELNSEYSLFERIKQEENRKYYRLKAEYDKALERERAIDLQIREFDEASREIMKRSESCIIEASRKMQFVDDKISLAEFNRIRQV